MPSTPSTAEEKEGRDQGAVPGIGGWSELLSSLSDEELVRYGKIAADQRRDEFRRFWAQMVCALAAVAALCGFVAETFGRGLTWRGVLALGAAFLLGYWPYRKAVVRRLWGKHCKAVSDEQARRRARQG